MIRFPDPKFWIPVTKQGPVNNFPSRPHCRDPSRPHCRDHIRTAETFLVYSLRTKMNAILGPNTQTNEKYEITKIPFVFYKKNLDIGLFFMRNFRRLLSFVVDKSKLYFLWDKF